MYAWCNSASLLLSHSTVKCIEEKGFFVVSQLSFIQAWLSIMGQKGKGGKGFWRIIPFFVLRPSVRPSDSLIKSHINNNRMGQGKAWRTLFQYMQDVIVFLRVQVRPCHGLLRITGCLKLLQHFMFTVFKLKIHYVLYFNIKIWFKYCFNLSNLIYSILYRLSNFSFLCTYVLIFVIYS